MEPDASFRGSDTAKIDDRGRFKIPSLFRAVFSAYQTRQVFITSEYGDYVRIYPLPAWIEIEKRLQTAPRFDEDVEGFLDAVNGWGQMAEIDGQDRVVIHPELRQSAQTFADIKVVGRGDHLALWDKARWEQRQIEKPWTPGRMKRLVDEKDGLGLKL
jgi:MraZ protein